MPYPDLTGNSLAAWPSLAAAAVTVGGVTVTCAQAAAADQVLAASRTSAIAPVLRAAGSPLAGCRYLAAAAPHLAAARAAPKTGRAGAAGRHVAKAAFRAALAAAVDAARDRVLAAAVTAFRADERYAAEMAADAVEVRRRALARSARDRVRAAALAAAGSCAAPSCARASACGTGTCPYAPPDLRAVTVAAGPGKVPRPAGHEAAGTGFGLSRAAAQAVAASPWRPAVPVRDGDRARAADEAA